MATVALTKRVEGKYAYDQASDLSPVKTITAVFDAAAAAAAKGSALAANDVVELVTIPAGSLLLSATVTVNKVEGAVSTVDVGDGVLPTSVATAVNANALATSAPASSKYFATADTIDVTLKTGAWLNSVITVKVVTVQL